MPVAKTKPAQKIYVDQTLDWDLVCHTVWDKNNLPSQVAEEILDSTWELQDGYGKTGMASQDSLPCKARSGVGLGTAANRLRRLWRKKYVGYSRTGA